MWKDIVLRLRGFTIRITCFWIWITEDCGYGIANHVSQSLPDLYTSSRVGKKKYYSQLVTMSTRMQYEGSFCPQ